MKNRIGRGEEFSPTEISQVLARYRRSGLGAVRFAQQHGIPPGRLHDWLYHKGRTQPPRPAPGSAAKPLFQELQVATPLPAVDGWVAKVNLPDGQPARPSSTPAGQAYSQGGPQPVHRPGTGAA